MNACSHYAVYRFSGTIAAADEESRVPVSETQVNPGLIRFCLNTGAQYHRGSVPKEQK